MGIAPEITLVVKHTFLEFIKTPEHKTGRARAFTDTELLESAGLIATTGAPAAEPVPESSPVCGPQWPMTPMLEAVFEPDQDKAIERGEVVDLEATMEVKAFLGMGECGVWLQADEDGSWLPPAATDDDILQDPSMVYQQPWVFVPFADFSDCCAVQGACWGEPGLWQPSTSSTASTGACSVAGSSSGDSFDMQAGETRTTVMLRNLPSALSRDTLLQMLDVMGFGGQFDLVYIPVDFSTGAGLGYAFINMTSPANVPRLWEAFNGLSQWCVASDKVCTVSWSDPHQGLQAHIERYQNSPVMHPEVLDEWKPALFMHGVRVEFPNPTKKIKAPKVRNKKSAAAAAEDAAAAALE